jgi:hypothetical protein
MFKNLPIASGPFTKVFNKKKVIGYVDLIEWSSIQGWVLRNERSSISLALHVGEDSYPLRCCQRWTVYRRGKMRLCR